MENTRTSRLSSGTLVALCDELSKIAEKQSRPPSRKKALKNALRTVALASGGYAAGHAGGMVADHFIGKAMGDRWKTWSTPTKKKILLPALGITSAGLMVANSMLDKKRKESLSRE